MAQKKSKKSHQDRLDPLSFLKHPHDRYIRFVLQTRVVALQMIQFCVRPAVLNMIDLETLVLSEDSFIDSRLQAHFSDVCYTGTLKSGQPFRVTLIFEHKSNKPVSPVLEQLNRYITHVWSTDLKQGRNLSVTIPVLIYHGSEPLEKETPGTIFPDVPDELLAYIPTFDYELLDIARIPDETLEHLEWLL